MSTPSLLNIPYRFKAGTLYSQLPETGAGDFTVTRATTPTAGQSTRVNAAGLIETVADNVPRLDYPLGGITAGCPALLIEPSAQNAFIESQTLFTTHLVQNLTTTGYTNAATSPDGSVTAEKFVPNTTPGVHGISNGSLLAIASGTTYTLSLFVKSDGGPYNLISLTFDSLTAWGATRNCIFNASNGTNFSVPSGATMTSENYGNGWYRIRATLTAVGNVAAAQYQYRIYVTDASGGLSWAAPSGNTNGVFCWGAQLETGSVPTSYIPTTTAAVTRSADVITNTAASALIGQSEGTIYAEIDTRNLYQGIGVFSIRSSTTNYVMIYMSSAARRFAGLISAAGASFTVGQTANGLSPGIYKMALAYKANDCAFYVNGVLVGSTSQATPTGMTEVSIAQDATSPTSRNFNDRIRAVAIYPNRIPNTAAAGVLSLATLTAP